METLVYSLFAGILFLVIALYTLTKIKRNKALKSQKKRTTVHMRAHRK